MLLRLVFIFLGVPLVSSPLKAKDEFPASLIFGKLLTNKLETLLYECCILMSDWCISPLKAMKAHGRCGVQGHWEEVGWLVRPPLPPVLILQEAEWTPGPVWIRRREEKFSPPPSSEIEPGSLKRQRATWPTEHWHQIGFSSSGKTFLLNLIVDNYIKECHRTVILKGWTALTFHF